MKRSDQVALAIKATPNHNPEHVLACTYLRLRTFDVSHLSKDQFLEELQKSSKDLDDLSDRSTFSTFSKIMDDWIEESHERAKQVVRSVLLDLTENRETFTSLHVKKLCREQEPKLPFFQEDVGLETRRFMAEQQLDYGAVQVPCETAEPDGFFFEYRPRPHTES